MEELRKALTQPFESGSGWDFRAVPEPFTRDVVESGRGLSSCALRFDCCRC